MAEAASSSKARDFPLPRTRRAQLRREAPPEGGPKPEPDADDHTQKKEQLDGAQNTTTTTNEVVSAIMCDPAAAWNQPNVFTGDRFATIAGEDVWMRQLRMRVLWRVENEVRKVLKRVRAHHDRAARAQMFPADANAVRAMSTLRVELARAVDLDALAMAELRVVESMKYKGEEDARHEAAVRRIVANKVGRHVATVQRRHSSGTVSGWGRPSTSSLMSHDSQTPPREPDNGSKRRRRRRRPRPVPQPSPSSERRKILATTAAEVQLAVARSTIGQFINMAARVDEVPHVRHSENDNAAIRRSASRAAPMNHRRRSRRPSSHARPVDNGDTIRVGEPPPPVGVSMSDWTRLLHMRNNALQAAVDYRSHQQDRELELRERRSKLMGVDSRALHNAQVALSSVKLGGNTGTAAGGHGSEQGSHNHAPRQRRSGRVSANSRRRSDHRHQGHPSDGRRSAASSRAHRTQRHRTPSPRLTHALARQGEQLGATAFHVKHDGAVLTGASSEDAPRSQTPIAWSDSGSGSSYGTDGTCSTCSRDLEGDVLPKSTTHGAALGVPSRDQVVSSARRTFEQQSGKEAVRGDLFIQQSLSLIFDLALHAMDTAEAAVDAIDGGTASTGPGISTSKRAAALETVRARSRLSGQSVKSGLSGMNAAERMLTQPASAQPG